MSADVLRETAALMRERARGVSSGPWISWVEGRDGFGGDDVILTADSGDLYVRSPTNTTAAYAAHQDYIASWHPTVALAVADWLDWEARICERADENYPAKAPQVADEHALNVARAYLGVQS